MTAQSDYSRTIPARFAAPCKACGLLVDTGLGIAALSRSDIKRTGKPRWHTYHHGCWSKLQAPAPATTQEEQEDMEISQIPHPLSEGTPIKGGLRSALRKWARAQGVNSKASITMPSLALRNLWNDYAKVNDPAGLAGRVDSLNENYGFGPDPIEPDSEAPAPEQEDNHQMPIEAPAPAPEAGSIEAAIRAIASQVARPVDTKAVIDAAVKAAVAAVQDSVKVTIEVKSGDKVHAIKGATHKDFERVLKVLAAGCPVYLVGPAGSGKTTIAAQCAEALGLPFYFNGAIASEYKLTGFIDAQGRFVSTAFRKAYEGGGVYLFDEIDASMPQALLAFNAALSNGHADFPDGSINQHPDFKVIAAANTFGRGADRVYVGRNQLDAASLDRFVSIEIDYDEALERTLSGNSDWARRVQRVRAAAQKLALRHVVSPRASIFGARLLAAGMPQSDVEESVLFKGLDKDQRAKLVAAI